MDWAIRIAETVHKMLVLVVLAGCSLAEPTSQPIALPDAPVTEPTRSTFEADSTQGWVLLAPGLEQNSYKPGDNRFSEIIALRIDPEHYTFRAHYRPGDPRTLAQWIRELPDAAAIVNGNFFDGDNQIVGLLVTDGTLYGQPYQGFGGLFAVQNGVARVRSNSLEPYRGEPLNQALQGFPMLVQNRMQAYGDGSSDRVARRTIVGQDGYGRVILMATPLVGMELAELSNYLASTDMGLVNAFNLDGGGSTMMYIAPGQGGSYMVPSFDPVPAVLAVYPR